MGKSKCTKCLFKNEFTTSYGTFYNFEVAFEDGIVGQYASKDKGNPKFKVGVEAEYEVEEKSGNKDGKPWSFNKIKPAQVDFKAGGGGWKKSDAEVAMECSRKICNSYLALGEDKTNMTTADVMVKMAGAFLDKLKGGLEKSALETACTKAAAQILHGIPVDSKTIFSDAALFDTFFKEHK